MLNNQRQSTNTFVNSIDVDWEVLLTRLENVVGKRPVDLNAVLFLIGVQELGRGPRRFSKEAKQDLMHIATCRVLSSSGYYTFEGNDTDGWPHWKLVEPLPITSLQAQEELIKRHVIMYFDEQFT